MSACTGKTTDSPNPPTPGTSARPSSSAAAGLPFAGAPKVANPLSATVLSGDPCVDALTPEQVRPILGAPLKQSRDDLAAVGPACTWANLDRGSQLNVGYATVAKTGLSGVYQNTKPQSGVWRPIADVQGFPAVAHAGSPGQTPKDLCVVTVGLADEFAVDVAVVLGSAKQGVVDPCGIAADAAGTVTATLKAKAGA
ncbi:DUF3558 domain-containing protein [Amycolatopsis oliviviridis]|nr:DUF3558 domain-containing protein [Amycolatopsis oliviviridis]